MKFFLKYENKGLSGLVNIGNTCFLNSCMQILSHTYELNDFLNNKIYKNKINKIADSIILLEWDKLRIMLWSQNCIIAPNGFVDAIRKISTIKKRDLFTGFNQNDISEFLLFIIECFHNALMREVNMEVVGNAINDTDAIAIKCYDMIKYTYSKEYSEIIDIFFGISVSHIKNLNGESLSIKPEPFNILSLSIPIHKPDITIFDCMDEYCKSERLDGDNSILNETTGIKEIANKNIFFWSLPNILIIDLKRYDSYGRKITNLIHTNLDNIDFTQYILGYNKYSYIYELYGICNHSGGTNGGHYTCIIKNANNIWYEFNDTNIREIQENKIITNKAYCFFYRKKK